VDPTIYNDNSNAVTTPNSGAFKTDSRYLRLRFDGIHEAIAFGKLSVHHLPGTEMLADALTKGLPGTGIMAFTKDIGLSRKHGADVDRYLKKRQS
jgi:hypothetical protein